MNGNSSSPASFSSQSQQSATGQSNAPNIDEHHCNCFRVLDKIQANKFHTGLKELGAFDQRLQEPHGQKWALTLPLDEFWQLHVKMMPNYHIEAEVEPRIRFVEHRTMDSRPAHEEVRQLLASLDIGGSYVLPKPEPCNTRFQNIPSNPTDIVQLGYMVFLGIMSITLFAVVLFTFSKRKSA